MYTVTRPFIRNHFGATLMHQQQQQEPGGIERLKANLGRGLFICECLAITLTVFLHKRFGRRYGGIPAAIGAVLIFLFAGLGAPHSPIPMLLFLAAYILMLAAARIERVQAEARGELRHSRYNGECRLARFFPKMDEITIKRRVEPALVLVLGLVMVAFSPPLGCYLIVASAALAVSVTQVVEYERAKAMMAVDAMIEGRMHAARVRERAGAFLN
jgi:hypothetical protein